MSAEGQKRAVLPGDWKKVIGNRFCRVFLGDPKTNMCLPSTTSAEGQKRAVLPGDWEKVIGNRFCRVFLGDPKTNMCLPAPIPERGTRRQRTSMLKSNRERSAGKAPSTRAQSTLKRAGVPRNEAAMTDSAPKTPKPAGSSATSADKTPTPTTRSTPKASTSRPPANDEEEEDRFEPAYPGKLDSVISLGLEIGMKLHGSIALVYKLGLEGRKKAPKDLMKKIIRNLKENYIPVMPNEFKKTKALMFLNERYVPPPPEEDDLEENGSGSDHGQAGGLNVVPDEEGSSALMSPEDLKVRLRQLMQQLIATV